MSPVMLYAIGTLILMLALGWGILHNHRRR
jgi:hypothetical protein